MLIASKYEEMYAPEISDFVYITDNAYTSGEMRALERVMLKKLSYSLGSPLPPHFLRRNSRAGNVSEGILGQFQSHAGKDRGGGVEYLFEHGNMKGV